MLYAGSAADKHGIGSDFIINVNDKGAIAYYRISSQVGTATVLVGVSQSKIPIQVENGKA